MSATAIHAAVYLASASPRRRQLLRQLGIPFTVVGAGVDETRLPGEAPETFARRVAAAKARRGLENVRRRQRSPRPVVAADTCVVIDDHVLGKPADDAQARTMLRSLSGRTHRVLTAVAVHDGKRLHEALSETAVTFAALGEEDIERYWGTGEPRGKAGAYAIQGRAAAFVERIDGSYSGVVGLPLHELAALLEQVAREAR